MMMKSRRLVSFANTKIKKGMQYFKKIFSNIDKDEIKVESLKQMYEEQKKNRKNFDPFSKDIRLIENAHKRLD
jgi:predicted glycosyl hydrolase (DUF1957 family)